MAKSTKPGLGEIAYTSFGVGLGFMASIVVYTFLGMLLFVPGFILLKKEQRKSKELQSDSIKIVAYVLMGMGMIIGLGLGAGVFFNELGGEF